MAMRDLLVLPVEHHLLTTTLGYYRLRKTLPYWMRPGFLHRPHWRFWAIANRFLVEAPPTQPQLPAGKQEAIDGC